MTQLPAIAQCIIRTAGSPTSVLEGTWLEDLWERVYSCAFPSRELGARSNESGFLDD